MTFDFNKLITISGDKWKTSPFKFYSKDEILQLNFSKSGTSPTWQDIVLSGNGSLTLTKAKENGLNYLKLFGGTEQTGTPTPDTPMDIVSNNGAIRVSKNLCDMKTANIDLGHYISSNGVYSESVSNFLYVPYIKVQPNTTYTLSFSEELYYITISEYSANDGTGFIQRNAGMTGGNTSLTVTTQATTQYIRFGSNPYGNSNTVTYEQVLNIDWMLEQGATATEYKPYGQIYTDGITETIDVTGKNLFDANNVEMQANTAISADGSLITNNSTKVCMTYLPVKPNTTYTISGDVLGDNSGTGSAIYFRLAEYTSSKQFITRSGGVIGSSYTFTTGANTYFVRFHCLTRADINTYQLELGSTATTYENYFDGGNATAEDLLAVGTTKDEQNITTGGVTRKVGVKVLDGSENWVYENSRFRLQISDYLIGSSIMALIISHYKLPAIDSGSVANGEARFGKFQAGSTISNSNVFVIHDDNYTSLDSYKAWLVSQYTNGTPVIVVYPLATATTESVTAQPLSIQAGNNVIEITQASINNLPLEVSYKGKI